MHTSLANEGAGGTSLMTTGQVIRWWELRRLLYNAILLVVGVSAIMGMEWLMTKVIPLGDDAIEPMFLILGVVVYGILANVCYTLGWMFELWGRRSDPVSARQRGRWTFWAGMVFSCALTSLPFWFGCFYWVTHRGQSH